MPGDTGSPVDVPLPTVEAALGDWAFQYQTLAQKNAKATMKSSAALASSIKYNVTEFKGAYTLTISLADYYDYINKGVKGVKDQSKATGSPYSFRNLGVSYKMVNSLKNWGQTLTTTTRNQKKIFKRSTDYQIQGSFYGMAVNIKKYGIGSTFFWDKTYDAMVPSLAPMLAKALKEDVTMVMKQIFIIK